MHPSYSVIFFTTASGAGYGLLILMALFGGLGLIPMEPLFVVCGFVISLGLITFGLLSSTFHLGHPERAWRAFSQWKSSWLSREGIAAVLTYIPAVSLGLGWFFIVGGPEIWSFLAFLTVIFSLLTIYCTGMIYASLRTIREWNLQLVPYVYIVLGLATGAVLFQCLLTLFGKSNYWSLGVTFVLLAIGFLLKQTYWHVIDNFEAKYTVEDATGLGRFGKVRPLDPPHFQPNFLMREMGFKVARKHSEKLRCYTLIAVFFIPFVMLALGLLGLPILSVFGSLIALISVAVGIVLERWLFFAEAKHAVNLYYGTEAV